MHINRISNRLAHANVAQLRIAQIEAQVLHRCSGSLFDDEIAEAIRILFSATHNCAEGAGAAALAALIKERERFQGRRVAVILTGQNIDAPWMASVLAGDTPHVP